MQAPLKDAHVYTAILAASTSDAMDAVLSKFALIDECAAPRKEPDGSFSIDLVLPGDRMAALLEESDRNAEGEWSLEVGLDLTLWHEKLQAQGADNRYEEEGVLPKAWGVEK